MAWGRLCGGSGQTRKVQLQSCPAKASLTGWVDSPSCLYPQMPEVHPAKIMLFNCVISFIFFQQFILSCISEINIHMFLLLIEIFSPKFHFHILISQSRSCHIYPCGRVGLKHCYCSTQNTVNQARMLYILHGERERLHRSTHISLWEHSSHIG